MAAADPMARLTVSLREYLEARDDAIHREMEQRDDALRREIDVQRKGDAKAVDIAVGTVNDRLLGMNEFREQIRVERTDYVRISTFRWAVGFLLTLALLAISLATLLR